MPPFDMPIPSRIDFDAALAAAREGAALAAATAERLLAEAQTLRGAREAREAELRAQLAAVGLARPLTDRQAEALVKVLDGTLSTLPIGYVASPLDCAPLSVLERMGLVVSDRERVGELGPHARSLTVWRLKPPGAKVAIALKLGRLPTAETVAANDRRPS